MKGETLRTEDKQFALALLERHLDSAEPVNACIQNLNGVYTIEVSRPTNDPGEPDGADQAASSPIHVAPFDSVTKMA